MKIMLVFPPKGFTSKEMLPPLGLAYVAAVLEKNKYQVEIVDALVENYSWNKLKKKFTEEKPDVVGITALTENRFEVFKTAEIAKNSLPNSTIVLGGPHVFHTAQDTLEHIRPVDVIVRGEGEYTMLELCNKLKNNEPLDDVNGISFRKNGEIIHNKPRELIRNLDELPFPAYHLLKFEKYNFKLDVPGKGKLRAASIVTSRGCPFHCVFCETSLVFGKRWRARSPDNIIKEIEFLQDTYNIKALWFNDDTFTLSKKRIIDFCNLLIEKNIEIYFTCSIRVDTVDKELLKLMKDAGCYKIFYGVESGSQKILDDVVGKRITIKQIRQVSKWLDELGIIKNPSYVISFPEETYEDAMKTLQLMKEIGGEPSFSFLKIYPGTDVEHIARQKGILPKDFSWSLKSSMKEIETIPIVHGNAPIFRDKLSWEEISEIAVQWARMRKYPLAKKIPSILKNLKSREDLGRYLSIFKAYVKSFLKRDKTVGG